jgi:organic hydroperoxide reductase OsmC/OhrA
MSEQKIVIEWTRSGPDFRKLQYSREHTWRFDGGAHVLASASPGIVPPPWSNPAGVDPEEAYVASIASCHMLWWLSLAAKRGFDVEAYEDAAVGVLTTDEKGRSWMSTVTLNPKIRYGQRAASAAEEAEIHHQAHERCFIANSIKTRVVVQGAEQ